MSGNSAALGAAFGHGDWRTGLPHLFAVPLFLVGLFAGYLWILRAPTYRRCASILLIEALLLALFALLFAREGSPERNTLTYFGFAALPLLAMGLQNATLREVGRSAFPSTYVTGVLDTLAKSTGLGCHQPRRERSRHPHSQPCRPALAVLCPGGFIGQRWAASLPSGRFVSCPLLCCWASPCVYISSENRQSTRTNANEADIVQSWAFASPENPCPVY